MTARTEARASCPACGRMLGLRTLAWGQEEHAFACRGCGARLAKRTYLLPLLIIGGLAITVAGRYLLDSSQTWFWGPLWVALLLVVAVLTTRVRLAGDDVPDPPKDEIFTAPPPQSTYFRGSKGPPPKRDGD